ncbi:MAG: hypothetical protein ABSE73_04595 [Planctomycetota bacterium]
MPAQAETAYAHLLESLPLDPSQILGFKFPQDVQQRFTDLLEMKRNNGLDGDSNAELMRFLAAEAVIRVLKAKALQAVQARS